jgi:hypothetical protein
MLRTSKHHQCFFSSVSKGYVGVMAEGDIGAPWFFDDVPRFAVFAYSDTEAARLFVVIAALFERADGEVRETDH